MPSRFFFPLLALLFLHFNPALAATTPAPKPGDPGIALAFAAAAGEPEEVKTLIAAGADPNAAANSAGEPALSLAAMRKDAKMAEVLQALLDGGARIDIEDKKKQTPLFYAARAGNVKAVQFLLAHGADLNHADARRVTARTLASGERKPEVVKAMDNFVKSQAGEVLKEYEARNAEIAARNAEIEARSEELKARDEEIARQKAQMKEEAEKRAEAEREARLKRQKAREEKRAARERKQEKREKAKELELERKAKTLDKKALQQHIRDLSFHVCATEYWKFCRANKQQTDISREELLTQISAHETLADDAAVAMKEEFGAKQSYINKIIAPSTRQILEQMKIHATNANRRAEGIGNKKDLEERCADIADQWELAGSRPGQRKPGESKRVLKP